MASQTTNYHLVKPSYTDTADIADINGDMDIIDAALADKLDKANVYNGLDKSAAGYALDARQGKALNDGKLNKTDVYNGLDKTAAGFALDARQGKALDDNKANKDGTGASGTWGINVTGSAGSVAWGNVSGRPSVIDNLTSTSTTDALSAKQGKVLNDTKANGKQATWLPSNGYNPLTSETGYFCYSTNPNLIPAQGLPTERTTYGIIFGDCSGSYKSMLYQTVLGDLYTYKTNGTQEWLRLALLSEVNAKVSKAGDTMTGNLTVPKVVGLVNLPRIWPGNANDGVGSENAFRIREYGSGSSNLPNSNWYNILECRGSDANTDTQLALGQTNSAVYYRRRQAGTWQEYQRLDNTKHVTWATSITVNDCGHALVLIGHRFRVVVWLVGDAGIDIGVTYLTDSGVTGFYKEDPGNSITFGSTASGTNITITRSGNSFTMKSTDNTTNRSWTVYQY